MRTVFITGSSEGLGLMAGQLLSAQGHRVVLHARNHKRADDARRTLPAVHDVVVGDVSTLAAMREVAEQVSRLGPFDAVIHNVALGYQEPRRIETVDGLSQLWAVNVLAPYVLTTLMGPVSRLIYLSSGMHLGGDTSLDDLQWQARRWNGSQAYADTKWHNVLFAFAVARHWPSVCANAVSPGWVATRMGGNGAPDDLDQGHRTQAWLAVSDDRGATVSGRYFYHKKAGDLHPLAHDVTRQEKLLAACREASGLRFPPEPHVRS